MPHGTHRFSRPSASPRTLLVGALVLLAVSGGLYGGALAGLAPAPRAVTDAEPQGAGGELDHAPDPAPGGETLPEQEGDGAADAGIEADTTASDPSASFEGETGEKDKGSGTHEQGTQNSVGAPPTNATQPDGTADMGGQAPDSPADEGGGDIFSSTPSEAEEREFRAFLAGKASSLSGYLSQASACASDFERDSVTADLGTRRAHQGTCASLSQRLFSEYLAVRDRPRSNHSAYCDEQERLIGAYRCLATYVGCYASAWEVNVSLDDPVGHESAFRAPLASSASSLAEFHSYYDGLSL